MEDQDKIVTAVQEISQSHWENHNTPILLSALAPLLEQKISDFRNLLGPRKLKAFIKETGNDAGYKLIEHPTQLERVGVAPIDAGYEFPQKSPSTQKTIAANANREATLAFFRAMASLPETDLEKIVIPASVLVKLLK